LKSNIWIHEIKHVDFTSNSTAEVPFNGKW